MLIMVLVICSYADRYAAALSCCTFPVAKAAMPSFPPASSNTMEMRQLSKHTVSFRVNRPKYSFTSRLSKKDNTTSPFMQPLETKSDFLKASILVLED